MDLYAFKSQRRDVYVLQSCRFETGGGRLKITNRTNLPESIVKAVLNDSYDRGACDYSVTELLKPPRQRALQKRHADEIIEDAADMIYRLYGQIAHGILDRANEVDLSEKRFFATFQNKILSGQIDTLSLKDGILTDFKFSTVWKFKQNSPPEPDWVAQLNMQLELLRRNDMDAASLQIVGLVRDFRLSEARNNPLSYPQAQIVVVPIPMWPREQTIKFIESRIKLHEHALTDLPFCSKDERWAKADIYAVMKGKRAISGGLCTSEADAVKLQRSNPGTRIEFRPAQSVRCQDYCTASPFCTQYQKLKDESEVQFETEGVL